MPIIGAAGSAARAIASKATKEAPGLWKKARATLERTGTNVGAMLGGSDKVAEADVKAVLAQLHRLGMDINTFSSLPNIDSDRLREFAARLAERERSLAAPSVGDLHDVNMVEVDSTLLAIGRAQKATGFSVTQLRALLEFTSHVKVTDMDKAIAVARAGTGLRL